MKVVTSAIRILVKNRWSVIISVDTFFPNGSDLKGIRGWDALQSIGKKLPPTKWSLVTCTRKRKFLAATLWLVHLTDAGKLSVTNKVGNTRSAHVLWNQKESTIKFTKLQSACYLLILKNLLGERLGSSSSKLKEEILLKKKQGAIGCSQGEVLFVIFKLIYWS